MAPEVPSHSASVPLRSATVRRGSVIVCLSALPLLAWLFVGVYADREFREPHLFLKHRPTFKVWFYSPRGEASPSDVPGKEGYLDAAELVEERLYIEFVERR